ncbi:MAG: hypothetical protein V3V08_01145 [Nannocystaceae bacterium]
MSIGGTLRRILKMFEVETIRVRLPNVLSPSDAWAADAAVLRGDVRRVSRDLEQSILAVVASEMQPGETKGELLVRLRAKGPDGERAVAWLASTTVRKPAKNELLRELWRAQARGGASARPRPEDEPTGETA